MTSGQLAKYTAGPVYFFDQPTRPNRVKGTRSNIFHLNAAREGTDDSIQSNRQSEHRDSAGLTDRLSAERAEPSSSSSSSSSSRVLLEEYQRAAPLLLDQLAHFLSQQRQWTGACCSTIPRGVVNILNDSWHDATAGTVHLNSPEQTAQRRGKLGASSRQVSARSKRGAGERETEREGVVGGSVPSERRPQVNPVPSPCVKKRKQKSSRAHNLSTVSFSISSSRCKEPGWIIQPKQPSYDRPQHITVCQWVVERLQSARNHEKLQTPGQNLNKPLILQHYGESSAKLKDSRARRKAQPVTLVDGIPQIPQVPQQHPAQQKLHYRIDDGSSFIYYPSGCMAVCHSHSALSCGGFYTNVFSDSEVPVILATITAFGRGAVTHPVTSSITAVWDQDGGFISDHYGNISKEWNWQTDCAPKQKIVIQLSGLISVSLLSGTSAMLSFRCNNESVELPLSALPITKQSKEMTDGKFISDAAQDLLLAKKMTSPAVVVQGNRNLTLTPVSVWPPEVSQMVRGLEGQEEPSARWRRAGLAGRVLKKLQHRVRTTLDAWLDYYRVATGIKCPNTEQMPAAPLRSRLRREVQSAALPSLNPPEWADTKSTQPSEDGTELQELQGHLSASAERPADASLSLPRMPKKRSKEEPPVTQIGPLKIHGTIRLESVIIPKSPELQPAAVTCRPAPSSLPPSVPLTVCPVLLRAALLGEGRRRRCCCCSVTSMPVVTDLEYDTFVMGQPPYSQQILVVCVTLPRQPPSNTDAVPGQDTLEQLYRRRNKHRTMPCSQCQMDSFRLVRYEMSADKLSSGCENILLQQRHSAAPGMVLMYIKGKLLFVGYIFHGGSCMVRDLQEQISRARRDYRLGLSLPPDHKFSDTVTIPAAGVAQNFQHETLKGGDGPSQSSSVDKTSERKKTLRHDTHDPEAIV